MILYLYYSDYDRIKSIIECDKSKKEELQIQIAKFEAQLQEDEHKLRLERQKLTLDFESLNPKPVPFEKFEILFPKQAQLLASGTFNSDYLPAVEYHRCWKIFSDERQSLISKWLSDCHTFVSNNVTTKLSDLSDFLDPNIFCIRESEEI